MLQLFSSIPEGSQQTSSKAADPHTSFRDLQAQDVVIFANTIYESNFTRLMADPNDAEALAWFVSDGKEQLSFLHCCEIFNIDPDAVRASITHTKRSTSL